MLAASRGSAKQIAARTLLALARRAPSDVRREIAGWGRTELPHHASPDMYRRGAGWQEPSPLVYDYGHGSAPVTVGSYCSINETAAFLTGGTHQINRVTTCALGELFGGAPDDTVVTPGPIEVGSDVWIASEALILPGVKIGHGAVIAARAVVARDVAPYAVVGGVPARLLRYRFDEPTRAALLRIAWWDWPPEEVARESRHLMSSDVGAFIDRHDHDAAPLAT